MQNKKNCNQKTRNKGEEKEERYILSLYKQTNKQNVQQNQNIMNIKRRGTRIPVYIFFSLFLSFFLSLSLSLSLSLQLNNQINRIYYSSHIPTLSVTFRIKKMYCDLLWWVVPNFFVKYHITHILNTILNKSLFIWVGDVPSGAQLTRSAFHVWEASSFYF